MKNLCTVAKGVNKNYVSVLPTDDRWFDVTYKEDRPAVEKSFRNLIEAGVYREELYSDIVK